MDTSSRGDYYYLSMGCAQLYSPVHYYCKIIGFTFRSVLLTIIALLAGNEVAAHKAGGLWLVCLSCKIVLRVQPHQLSQIYFLYRLERAWSETPHHCILANGADMSRCLAY